MTKNIVIVVLILLLIGTFFIPTKNDKTEVALQKIDSLKVSMKIKDMVIDSITKNGVKLLASQSEYEKIADSLGLHILNHDMDCPEELVTTNKQLLATQRALELCKKVTTIETTKYGICMDIRTDLDTIVITQKQIIKFDKKDKRKAFLKGVGVGVVGAALIILLAM